jgi:MFS family permease
MAIFQQLTGINFIMLYSNTLFKDMGLAPAYITGLVGIVNFLTTFGGLYLLSVAGRRTIMVYCSAAMSAVIVLNGICIQTKSNTLAIICTMSFIALFEFSSGPITWLYMAEIMQDKAVGIATVLNWTVNLLISYFTQDIINALGDDNIGYLFIGCGGFTVLGTVFMVIFMKETRGKSAGEIEEMFAKVDKKQVSLLESPRILK